MKFFTNVVLKVILLALAILIPLSLLTVTDIEGNAQKESYSVSLGEPYQVTTNLYNVPDTRTSYLKLADGNIALFVSADVNGVRLDGAFDEKLTVWAPRTIITPDKTFKAATVYQGYRTPGLVFQVLDRAAYCAVVHTEYWQGSSKNFPFSAEIQVMCADNLLGFSNPVTVLTGLSNTTIDPIKATGVGQPCGLIRDGFLYVYFTNWDAGLDAIHVARAPLDSLTNPDSWFKYLNGQFNSKGLGGDSTAVVLPPTSEDHFAAVCSVSWNSYLGKYLMSYETEKGFYFTTSDDGLTWDTNTRVIDFSEGYRSGSVGSAYFIPLSFDTGDQFVTGQSGTIIFRRIVEGRSLNTMYALPFQLS